MPGYIVKAAPDEDFYVIWSTVVDNITFSGTQDEVADYERMNSGRMQAIDPEHRVDARIARADATGTSAMWPEEKDGPDKYLGWNDETFLVSNDDDDTLPGFFEIKRSDLRHYAEHGGKDIFIPIPDEDETS